MAPKNFVENVVQAWQLGRCTPRRPRPRRTKSGRDGKPAGSWPSPRKQRRRWPVPPANPGARGRAASSAKVSRRSSPFVGVGGWTVPTGRARCQGALAPAPAFPGPCPQAGPMTARSSSVTIKPGRAQRRTGPTIGPPGLARSGARMTILGGAAARDWSIIPASSPVERLRCTRPSAPRTPLCWPGTPTPLLSPRRWTATILGRPRRGGNTRVADIVPGGVRPGRGRTPGPRSGRPPSGPTLRPG